MSMADSSLSNPTLVFGLSLWVIAGVGVGAGIVVLLFLFSLWLFSKRKLLGSTLPATDPTQPKELISVQVQPDLFSDPGKVDGVEHQALLVEPDPLVQNRTDLGAGAEVSHLGWGHWYTLRELENATNGFAHGNVIGEGGYGIVYFGVLDDNTQVAVKNLFNNR